MDSDHRHELKENDLEHFLGNFGPWWKKHGSTLLLWVLLIALVIVGWNLFHNVRAGARNTAWDDLAGATSPTMYPAVAEENSDATVKVLASLWGGDALVQEAIAPRATGDQGPVDPLSQAEAMYRQVLDLTDEPVFRANAYLGLATVAESRGAFDDAAAQYDQAIAAAGDRYATLAERATQAKAMLDRLREPVVFAKASEIPVPAEENAESAIPSNDESVSKDESNSKVE